jgi:hypothetical protein
VQTPRRADLRRNHPNIRTLSRLFAAPTLECSDVRLGWQETRKRVLELRRCAQAESKVEMDVQAGIFTQAELYKVSGLNSVTVDTRLIRDILRTTKVGGRTLRWRRLFSVLAIFEAKVTGELVTRLSLPPSEASEVARSRRLIGIRPMIGNPGSSRQSKEQRSSPAFFR